MPALTRTSAVSENFPVLTGSSLTNGPPIWSHSWSNSLGGNNSVTFDPYKVPSYRRLIREGSSATSTLEGVEYRFSGGSSRFAFGQTTGYDYPDAVDPSPKFAHYFTGVMGSPLAYASLPTNTTASLDRANNAALSQFATRCFNARTQLQGGVVLGELGKTIAMIRNPMRGIYSGIGSYLGQVKKLGRGVKSASKTRKSLDKAADLWLEYSYGWAPLVSDIKNGAKAAGALTQNAIARKRVSGIGRDSTNFPGDGLRESNEGGGRYIQYTVNQRSNKSVRYTGSVQLRVDGLGRPLQMLGLDWPSFVPTIWELIPYSFLVDYFSNAGDIVYALSNPASSLAWCEKGTLEEASCEVSVQGCRLPVLQTGERYFGGGMNNAASGSASKRYVHRGPYNGSLMPSLQLQLPGFGLKWLNMAALAVTHSSVLRSIRSD